ncbi:MAG: hypothetical protein NW237_05345 [Cyanobacteriota bacterium]|nr:hypothetical protein [Cyanobacteriota bacterium]
MSVFTTATLRRLQKLPQIPAVWEGDRRPLQEGFPAPLLGASPRGESECILWVDGSQGVVRSMDVVPMDAGMEVMVRSLLQAMEHPHSAKPARPQKIVVRNREVQFFLRGILQDLDIKIDCQADLPLIDEIFESFGASLEPLEPNLPPELQTLLEIKARQIWQDAPWDYLEDHQVLEIQLKQWDLDTLYVSVMGMLGMEHGVLFYRSLDSMKQFRHWVASQPSPDVMEEAFLSQDCLFLNYSAADPELEAEDIVLSGLPPEEIEPTFGTIHPLEGLRPLLQAEEGLALVVMLEALHRFFQQTGRVLANDFVPETRRFRIPHPQPAGDRQTISVQVRTLPDLATELLAMGEAEEGGLPTVLLREDLLPDKAHLAIGMIPWSVVEALRLMGLLYPIPEQEIVTEGDGFPVVIVQTTRPKAKVLIEHLREAGSPQALCFNDGVDPWSGERYDLEIIQTGNGELHLFGEFLQEDPTHVMARRRWDRRCQLTGKNCGLLIAMGSTSVKQDGLQLRHMLALFQLRSLTPTDLGLGTIVRMPLGSDIMGEAD